jgi:hypothetical protein
MPAKPASVQTEIEVRDVQARFHEILGKYLRAPMPRDSEDSRFIDELAKHPPMAIAVIDDLIQLTQIREEPLLTTEDYTAITLSPGGRVLAVIGEPAKEKVKRALEDTKTRGWQRSVLTDVLRIISGQPVDERTEIYSMLGLKEPARLVPEPNTPFWQPPAKPIERSAPPTPNWLSNSAKPVTSDPIANVNLPLESGSKWFWGSAGGVLALLIVILLRTRSRKEM